MYTETNNSTTNSQPLITEPFYSNELLICATKGYIFALRKSTGKIIWKLTIDFSTCTISLFITDNDTIIAGTSNKTFSIDLMTGKINWINTLNRVEYKEVNVLAIPSPQLQYQSFNPEEHELDVPPPYEDDYDTQITPYILALSKGLVTAIDPRTGTTQWRYRIPLNAQQLPVAIVDPPTKLANRPTIFIGISSTVYSLDARSGELNWSTKLPDSRFGSKYITLASSWSSKLAAETHTSFNQNPVIIPLSSNP